MIQLFQPLLSLFVGVAMTAYGLLHSISRFPGTQTFSVLAANLPALSAFLLFVIGVMAFVAGVILIVAGTRALRRRWRRFDELARLAGRHPDYDDADWEPTRR